MKFGDDGIDYENGDDPNLVMETPLAEEDPVESIAILDEIRSTLNRFSAENVSGTPDFVLAEFMLEVLKSFNEAVHQRAAFRGEIVDFRPEPEAYSVDAKEVKVYHSGEYDIDHILTKGVIEADGSLTINVPGHRFGDLMRGLDSSIDLVEELNLIITYTEVTVDEDEDGRYEVSKLEKGNRTHVSTRDID